MIGCDQPAKGLVLSCGSGLHCKNMFLKGLQNVSPEATALKRLYKFSFKRLYMYTLMGFSEAGMQARVEKRSLAGEEID